MANAIADVTTTTESSQGDPAAMAAALEGLGIFRGVQPPEQPAAPAEPVAPSTETQAEAAIAAAIEVDPLVFSEERLATAEGIKAAKAAIETEVKKANDLRKKAHNAHAAAEAREAKFKKTKDAALAIKSQFTSAWEAMQADIGRLQQGSVEDFLNGVARLRGTADPAKFWREASLNLAAGGKLQLPEPTAFDPVALERIQQLEQHVIDQGRRETDAQIANLRAQQVQFAQMSQAHPLVRNYATANPQVLDQALMHIRETEFARTGRPIDAKVACDMLETELKAQYELLQRANGQTTGEKEATGLGPEVGRVPNAAAKPGMTPSASQAQHATTIPASLSAQPAAAMRPTTKRERDQAIANALPSAFWRNLGFQE